ncbi:hypothetical protein ACS0TY_016138 [Phlomoides rotata]
MAASLHSISLTPQTLSLHHSSSGAAVSASSLFAPISLKPLPKLVLSLSFTGNYGLPASRFVRNVAISSGLEEDVEDGDDEDFDSGAEEQHFAPELKLFVGNLPFNVDSAVLAGLFEQAGNVEMVEVIYDKTTGRSRGFGFVTMSTTKEVEAAAQQLNGYELQGRAIRVNSGPAPPKRENSYRDNNSSYRDNNSSYRDNNSSFRNNNSSYRDNNSSYRDNNSSYRGSSRGGGGGGSSFDNTNRVYVGNLAWGVDNLTLETLFGEKGKVKEATVVYDRETGRSRGFGFISFSSSADVDNAIRSLDGMDVDGRSIRVSRAEERTRREY